MTGLYETNALITALSGRKPLNTPISTLLGAALIKRKAFFSFHYDDIMCVNNVRNAWKIDHPDSPLARSFYDSSLWESRRLESDDTLKKLIREGVEYTSAVCVLIGTETWSRRWVKYEIARSVIDGRGLLAVHLNGINHHQRETPDPLGYNPLHLLGIYRSQNNQFLLYENRHIQGVINLLSNNSFLLKGWSVILVSGLFALAAKDTKPLFVYFIQRFSA